MEPTTSIGIGALFAKYSVTIAGFWGSILSLGFLKDLTRFQAALAVGTGFGCSTYWTQPVAGWLSRTYLIPLDDALLAGVAFTIGLLAMNVIPGLKAFAERVLTPRGA
ncbi:peptidase M48, Ste24p [Pseudomonas aeruginosa]|uniref:peptidase M48, Ste24p n=1 Tax=Pseudomonas aeruginosa TaxID=287 RepID=UPI000F53EE59|nr:peptidase M48, Ste24p [Pseudomonas aeruginosa]RQD56455.1 peptidase M48, Ste24p [Pseudomonas aeruginosa]